MFASTNYLTGSHMPVVVRGRDRSKKFPHTIDLLGECGGVEAGRGSSSLHRFPIDQDRECDDVSISTDCTGVDIHNLQRVGLIPIPEGHPLSLDGSVNEHQECNGKQEFKPTPGRKPLFYLCPPASDLGSRVVQHR